MKSLTERRLISSIDLINGWSETELNLKYRVKILETKLKFKEVKQKSLAWPEIAMKNF